SVHLSSYLRAPHSFPTRRSSDLRYDVRRIFRYMEALRHRDVARLLAFVHDAAELESRLPVPPEFVARLSEFVPAAEIVTYCELRSEEHTSELQSRRDLVCRLLLE